MIYYSPRSYRSEKLVLFSLKIHYSTFFDTGLLFPVRAAALDRWNERCIAVTINASLKSEVLLPCNFVIGNYNETESVNWEHYSRLVTITINGKILFDSPTEGRVNVFPLLSKHGNFSILIHDLQASDIGTYFCKLNSECRRVNIIERPDISQKTEDLSSNQNSWLFFFAGAGLFILLFIIFNRTGLQNQLLSSTEKCLRSSKSSSTDEEHNEASAAHTPSGYSKPCLHYEG
ncbi:hypothetical protein Q8A67_018488 [Cirrhinus molitorella]|uniref:Ig-like domain-containing protein n=1 Tax=Cirrhinus molitorella TaxID=172907 RepID=A0AA88TQS7_9TELE|nr:hypothetical protein Q8A67_018488 [Cirrhinus molitorella]